MLEELHVRNLALIEEVWLEFGPGLTVLSGETGAGKTALVGALKLLVGARGDSTMVRSGAPETLVDGRFTAEGREVLVRRRLSADGRSRCSIDGEMATVSGLAEQLGPLVDLHGQHEHQALLSPAAHAGYLDRYAGIPAVSAREGYAAARTDFVAARSAFDRLQADIAEANRTSDYLEFVVAEIDHAAPLADEDSAIERRLPALKHADRLTAAVSEALAFLRDEAGAQDRIASAGSSLARISGLDPVADEFAARLLEVDTLLADLGVELREYAEGLEHDPDVLNELMARLSILSDLKKKYGPRLADVARTRDEAHARLSAAKSGSAALEAAGERCDAAETALRAAGDRLVAVHAQVAPQFVSELAAATADLEMPGVRFEVSARDLPFESWGEEGPQQIEFMYASAPDTVPRPLAKIASGGEISRVMLALKGVLGAADGVPVLVFDEVDSGIGGVAAVAVGRRLKELAARHQVLVVTHLAQVAAFADAHLVVDKDASDGRVRTSVSAVRDEDRVSEIARMLSGSDTKASRAHARELLDTVAAG